MEGCPHMCDIREVLEYVALQRVEDPDIRRLIIHNELSLPMLARLARQQENEEQ
jgi:hypothetical protein